MTRSMYYLERKNTLRTLHNLEDMLAPLMILMLQIDIHRLKVKKNPSIIQDRIIALQTTQFAVPRKCAFLWWRRENKYSRDNWHRHFGPQSAGLLWEKSTPVFMPSKFCFQTYAVDKHHLSLIKIKIHGGVLVPLSIPIRRGILLEGSHATE